MTMARSGFRQTDLKRALTAAKDAEIPVIETRILPDGTILLRHVAEKPMTGDELAEWRARRAAQA